MRRGVIVGVMVAVTLSLSSCAGNEEPSSSPTAALPEITLESFTQDEPLDLSTLEGPAVVNFWASWCAPCRRELPIVEAFAEKNPDVTVLGINFQDQQTEAAADLLARSGADYPMYVDTLGELSGQEPFPNLRGLPYTALVDARGRLVFDEFVELESVDQLEGMVRQHLAGEGLS